jgi:phosphoribosylformylglycinamidine (FGAM) synthase-like amidotransferase family enzyme
MEEVNIIKVIDTLADAEEFCEFLNMNGCQAKVSSTNFTYNGHSVYECDDAYEKMIELRNIFTSFMRRKIKHMIIIRKMGDYILKTQNSTPFLNKQNNVMMIGHN